MTIESIDARLKAINDERNALHDEERELKRKKAGLQAAHHGAAIGDIVKSAGYSHKGKLGQVVAFVEAFSFGDGVARPTAIVNLIKADGKIGEAQHEFRSWEVETKAAQAA